MKTKRSLWGISLALAFSLLAMLSFASCSSVPPSQKASRVEKLVEELNTEDTERLIELSARPFLLDAEIINREEDVRILWTNLRDSGFSFANAYILSIDPALPAHFARFSNDPETQAYFEKYLSGDAALVQLQTDYGRFLLLTGSKLGRIPLIYGFTGPEVQ